MVRVGTEVETLRNGLDSNIIYRIKRIIPSAQVEVGYSLCKTLYILRIFTQLRCCFS
jgi:hypothetical protein